MPASGRGSGVHDAGTLKSGEMPIEAWPGHINTFHQFPDGGRPRFCKVAQDVSLGPVAHMSDGHINLRRERGHDQAWHVPILPEISKSKVTLLPQSITKR